MGIEEREYDLVVGIRGGCSSVSNIMDLVSNRVSESGFGEGGVLRERLKEPRK